LTHDAKDDFVAGWYRDRARKILRADGLSIADRNFLRGLETGKLSPMPLWMLSKLIKLEKAAKPVPYVAPVFFNPHRPDAFPDDAGKGLVTEPV
jgi:hypothetical protein